MSQAQEAEAEETEEETEEEQNEEETEAEEMQAAKRTFDDLNENQKQKIMSNPEVRKMIEYSEKNLPQIAGQLNSLVPDEGESDETYDLFTQGVADRSGRVTQATVKKVISGMIEEGRNDS